MRNASKSLIKEKTVLEKLSKHGIPVPDVVDFGEGYLVLSDVGDAVINIIEKRHTYYSNNHPKFHVNGNPQKEKILTKASTALAKFHKMEMPEEKIRKILKISKEPISMETPIGDDEDSHLGDFY